MPEDHAKRDEEPAAEPPSPASQNPSPAARAAPQPAAPPPAREDEGWLSRTLRSVFGSRPESIRAELMEVLAEGAAADAGFSPRESEMLRNILALKERRLEDVMIPRADIVAVASDVTLGELLSMFKDAAHSRLVVYGENLDEPQGLVHIRDLIGHLASCATPPSAAEATARRSSKFDLAAIDFATPLSATKIVRTILFAPPSMSAVDLLAKMQATRIHLALVIDEFGGTDGLVSIEDLVEQIVGDIEDEHDEASGLSLVLQPDGTYLADGRATLEAVGTLLGPDFDLAEANEEIDTLGGYLAARLGRVPVRGEVIPGPGPFEIEVVDAAPRRVNRVRIRRSVGSGDADALRGDNVTLLTQDHQSSSKQTTLPRRRKTTRRS